MSVEDALCLAAWAVLVLVLVGLAPRALMRRPHPETEADEPGWDLDGPVIDAEPA